MLRVLHSAHALQALTLALTLIVACKGSCTCGRTTGELAELAVAGSTIELRKRDKHTPKHSTAGTPLLVIALDGIDREILYDLLTTGSLPETSSLLGGIKGAHEHAHLEENLLSTLPSITMAAWTTAFTGKAPGEHGVTGNEFFIRETQTFAAPAPVTITAPHLPIQTYTDGYLNALVPVPTVYQQLRAREPHISIWVAMHGLHQGADTLILTSRAAMAGAFGAMVEETIMQENPQEPDIRRLYASLDQEVMEETLDAIKDRKTVPDVLTIYFAGIDLYAHVAPEGPDQARRDYLKEIIDPLMGELRRALMRRDALEDRYIVITSDHGHTRVVHDDAHALSMKGPSEPPELLRKLGFRLRPFEQKVSPDTVFDAVFAYQGAMAYVYLADRSTCSDKPCDWNLPPRFEEDVLVVAEAFYKNSLEGHLVPTMKDSLDLVLAWRPVAAAKDDLPFEVYEGAGRLTPVEEFLSRHPHPGYLRFAERLRDLATGERGERAGDVLLIARNGAEEDVEARRYFADVYHSWHGSPSRKDSEIPLIVAHPKKTASQIAALTRKVLGPRPSQQRLTPLLMRLRQDKDDAGR